MRASTASNSFSASMSLRWVDFRCHHKCTALHKAKLLGYCILSFSRVIATQKGQWKNQRMKKKKKKRPCAFRMHVIVLCLVSTEIVSKLPRFDEIVHNVLACHACVEQQKMGKRDRRKKHETSCVVNTQRNSKYLTVPQYYQIGILKLSFRRNH